MNSPETTFRLGYVTDVEGNLEYFHKFVQASSVLTWKGAKETTAGTEGSPPPLTAKDFHLDLCGDHCYFVYGGDAVDKVRKDKPMPYDTIQLVSVGQI